MRQDRPSPPDEAPLRRAFVTAIACFVLAAAAGTLMRFGMIHGLPYGWQHVNVRFAHTHLMSFGWATPALFALIGSVVARRTARPLPRAFHAALWASLAGGVGHPDGPARAPLPEPLLQRLVRARRHRAAARGSRYPRRGARVGDIVHPR